MAFEFNVLRTVDPPYIALFARNRILLTTNDFSTYVHFTNKKNLEQFKRI